MVVDYEKLRRHHQPRNVETDITVAAAAQSLQSSMMYNHITDGSLSQKRKRNEKKNPTVTLECIIYRKFQTFSIF